MKINEVTICLYCALPEVVEMQMKALEPVEKKLKVYWNNRIDRHPDAYDSYSEMVNESVATSPTEWIVVINDRTVPTSEEFFKIIDLLKKGYAVATQWSVAYMGLSKEVFRKVGMKMMIGFSDYTWLILLIMNHMKALQIIHGKVQSGFKVVICVNYLNHIFIQSGDTH